MTMLSYQRRTRLSIDAAGVVVVTLMSGLFFMGAVLPAINANADRAAVLQAVELSRTEIHRVREQANDVGTYAAKLEADLASTRVEIEPLTRLNARLARLTELASSKSLVLDRLAPGTPTKGVKATLVPIRVEGKGSFLNARQWIAVLRQEFPDISIVGLEIARDQPQSENASRFSFDLIWYAALSAKPGISK
jgi:hypothetical protein